MTEIIEITLTIVIGLIITSLGWVLILKTWEFYK